ncbi:MAG: LysR family transcriptional regulator [Gammaproteobacteria bacterium]|nr:MAG: LysR family transcriptional regulator [Gammaproteobacteria bacterium]
MCSSCGIAAGTAQAQDHDEYSASLSGYVRTTVGVSLNDHDETKRDDKWEATMARGTLLLDLDVYTGPLIWKAVGRLDKEYKTNYLKDLQKRADSTGLPGDYSGPGGDDWMEQYDTHEFQDWLREIYVDFTLFDKVDVRLGRQQLVWGESDFFQAMDLVHGFDWRWRLFFENNEEWRKPLYLANFNIEFYDLDGALNFFVRPGLDRDEDMGSSFNIEGGRWIPHPYRGVDFTQFTTAYETDHNKGDWSDWTYGIRWGGTLGSIGYSFAYLKTFMPRPTMNPNPALNGAFGINSDPIPYGDTADNGAILGDWIYPEIDVYGFTVNGYSSTLDSTLSAEVAYVPNTPFNYGQLQSDLPGWQGVKEKDVINAMLRIDKEFKLMNLLGTNRPSLSSVQLFDTWITSYDDDDEIVEFASFGHEKDEHTVYLTFFTLMNFRRDTINPSFVIGTDVGNGGGFAIPAVEFVIGDNWRLKVEADLFWSDSKKKVCGTAKKDFSDCDPEKGNPLLGMRENKAALFDWFADDNQLVFKLTRQF